MTERKRHVRRRKKYVRRQECMQVNVSDKKIGAVVWW